MTAAGSNDQQRAFESEVLAYFRSSFHDYCEQAHRDPGLDLRGAVIQAQLITVHPLRHVAAEIRRQATTFGRRLVRAERVDVRFPVQPQLAAPGYRLEIGHPAQHEPEPGTVLRLSYGGATNWEFPLISGPNWVPLGRSLPAQRGSRGFVIPETMLAVPRGVLLEVRHLLGATEICRSEQRPEYTVEVDGFRLEPGYLVTVGDLGSIVYSRAGAASATRLRYRVDRKV